MKKTELDTPNDRVQWEVADIFRLYGGGYRQSHSLPYEKIKVMHHIEVCRELPNSAVMSSDVTNAGSSRSLITHAETGIAPSASAS